jgi:peptidoglycan/LPS O-acetylase OafA/YrhL
LTFLGFGRVGVEIFFVISGFIIAHSAERASAFQFFRSRVVRLMPGVWIVAPITYALTLLINFAAPRELSVRLFRSLIFYPFGPWIDGVYWTLPIEIVFYTLVFSLLTIRRFRWLQATMTLIGLLSCAFWLGTILGLSDVIPIPANGRRLELILISHGCLFALGVFLWLCLTTKFTGGRAH